MSKTLLIVDDSALVRKAVIKTLEPTRILGRILQAKHGIEALDILLKDEVDLLLADIHMPKMDGFKLLTTLRHLEKYRDLPVIVLSLHNKPNQKIRGLQEGANDYVTKPFEPGELIARIKNLLKMKDLQDELARKNKAMEQANKRLEQLSVTDELTGLWNRRYLRDRLAEEISRASRFKQMFSCLMIDIDDFKDINDTHGHITGDIVLIEIAKFLKSHCRAHDLLARFGGEEFVMILHQTELKGAMSLGQQLVKAIEGYSFMTEAQKPLKATISIGVATYPARDVCGINDLIKKADEGLYQAKRKGKNRSEKVQTF